MKRKKWFWLLIIVLALLFGWRIFQKIHGAGTGDNPGFGGGSRGGKGAVAVETGPVVTRDMADLANFSGTLNPASKVIITAKVAGQLSLLHVNIGDKVRKGQLIAELDSRLYEQEYAKARATAEQTQDALNVARKELTNLQTLKQNNYISQTDYDKANSDFIATKSRNDVAQAAKNTAEIQLSYTKIKADWNGLGLYRVIGEKFVDEGSMLNIGMPIVTMLDINNLIVVINIIESDYARIKSGQAAEIRTDTYPGQVFAGKIERIAPLLEEASRQARVEISLANPQGLLRPGMYAKVQIAFQNKKNVTAIPAAAVFNNNGEEGIYLVNKAKHTVQFIPIRTGIRSGDWTEVISPPLEGDVVTLGQEQLKDGSAVILPGEGRSNPSDKPAGAK